MKIWSVFSLVIVFHFVIIGLLLFQPGCQSRPQEEPDPSMTAPTAESGYEEPVQTEPLDPAFNAGIGEPSSGSGDRALSSPTRPDTVRRSEPDMGMLEPVREPVADPLAVPEVAREYTVRKGDTLTGIARSQGVSLSGLMSANGLTRSSTIYVGQTLLIPESRPAATTATAASSGPERQIEVKRGDTLSAIAKRHGISVRTLKAMNGLRNDTIYVGQTLKVPSASAGSEGSAVRSSPGLRPGMLTYTVKAGDTPTTIARRYGITARSLMAANNITDPRKLYVGRKLVIPGQEDAASPAMTETTAATTPEPVSTPPVRTEVTPSPTPAGSADSSRQTDLEREEDPMAALEALEDEELPYVEVEILEEDTGPEN